MINRDISNKELFSDVRGRYMDSKLVQKHSYKVLNEYIRKKWNDDDIFNDTVSIHKIDFPDGEVKLELISKEILDESEIKEFCKTFDLVCKDVFLRVGFNNYAWLVGRTKLGEDSTIIYTFIREKCEVYYLSTTKFDLY